MQISIQLGAALRTSRFSADFPSNALRRSFAAVISASFPRLRGDDRKVPASPSAHSRA